MANTMRLQIITPMRTILDEEIESVILHTTEGEMCVLYDHEPTVTLLGYKDIVYTQGGQKKKATALGGFAEITKDKVTVLTDASELANEIDLERAEGAKERAEQRIHEKASDTDILRAETALQRAVARIEVLK